MIIIRIDVKPRNQHSTTSATQGSTIYRKVKPAKLLPHMAHSSWINRTGLTSWAFTRWCDRHTSDKVAHYSIYRPLKDERLSWHSWLTYSGRFTQIIIRSPISYTSTIERGTRKVHRSEIYCATQPSSIHLGFTNFVTRTFSTQLFSSFCEMFIPFRPISNDVARQKHWGCKFTPFISSPFLPFLSLPFLLPPILLRNWIWCILASKYDIWWQQL